MTHPVVTRLVLILIIAGVVSACDTAEPEDLEILVPREVRSSQYTETESGLKYFDFKTGDGDEAVDTSNVEIHAAAWLTNRALISSTFDSDNSLSLDLDSEDVVAGLAEGVVGMKVGGERGLLVPPELAFGDVGIPGAGIPGGASIIYEIELLAVE